MPEFLRRISILFVVVSFMIVGRETMSNAQSVSVQFENLQSSDGFFFTPLWVGFHDGSFDLFDQGALASGSLELLAEEGDASLVRADFAGSGTDGVFGNASGFPNAPVIDPGETATAAFDIGANERYFSFASMIIPSNDGFIGNDNELAYELFDSNGNFNGPVTIEIFASDIYDSGTELNDGLGAAFSANGGEDTVESNLIAVHEGLDNFLGTETAAGTTIGTLPGNNSPIARITVTSNAIPEPTAAGLLLIGGIVACNRRVRRSRFSS